MRFRKILFYALYAVIVFGTVVAGSWVAWNIKVWVGRTYQPTPGQFTFSAIYITIGLMLGLEHLAKEFRRPGKWSVHKTRLIILGIPSAVLAFYLALAFGLSFPDPFPVFIAGTNILFYVSGIIFGYILSTSFYKKANETSQYE